MIIPETLITVDTGKKSWYVFKKAGTSIVIYTSTNDNGIEHEYFMLVGQKPTKAILRLVERAAELERFFKLVQKHSAFTYPSLILDSMPSREDIEISDDEDADEDWDFMSQMLEAAERHDELSRGVRVRDGGNDKA